jgi:hypothetical protein
MSTDNNLNLQMNKDNSTIYVTKTSIVKELIYFFLILISGFALYKKLLNLNNNWIKYTILQRTS